MGTSVSTGDRGTKVHENIETTGPSVIRRMSPKSTTRTGEDEILMERTGMTLLCEEKGFLVFKNGPD